MSIWTWLSSTPPLPVELANTSLFLDSNLVLGFYVIFHFVFGVGFIITMLTFYSCDPLVCIRGQAFKLMIVLCLFMIIYILFCSKHFSTLDAAIVTVILFHMTFKIRFFVKFLDTITTFYLFMLYVLLCCPDLMPNRRTSVVLVNHMMVQGRFAVKLFGAFVTIVAIMLYLMPFKKR